MKFSSSFALVALSSIVSAYPCLEHERGNSTSSGVASRTGSVVLSTGSAVVSSSNSTSNTTSNSTSNSTSSSTNVVAATTTDGPIGYASTNGGTTGGEGGTTTTVSTLPQFTAAVVQGDDSAKVIYVSGAITGATKVYPGSNTSIIGLNSESALQGIGLYIKGVSNVIVRNLKIHNVLAENGDAIGIQAASNVWIDHNELYSDLDHDKDYYDGLCDVTHASEWVTISNNYFHDHFKASLTGHSDSNADEDTGHLHVTYANNYWSNISSRAPSVRFGHVHIINSYYENILSSTVNTRQGAQVLVESTVFSEAAKPITAEYSDVKGFANTNDVVLGSGANDAPEGTFTTQDAYKYTLLGSDAVKAAVVGTAGNTLSFM